MNSHVLVKIALLSKRLAAAQNWTYIRFFLGVRSQVIEKIVPFLKTSLAVMKLTEKNLGPSLTFRLKIFNVFEGP